MKVRVMIKTEEKMKMTKNTLKTHIKRKWNLTYIMVCKQILLRTNGNITTEELDKYGDFFKCSRCLYEKTIDEYSLRKSGQKLKECKECRSKAIEYRLKKKNETKLKPENSVEPETKTKDIVIENMDCQNELNKVDSESSEDETNDQNTNRIFTVRPDFFDNMNYLTDFYLCCNE